jgi:hypothetical protein
MANQKGAGESPGGRTIVRVVFDAAAMDAAREIVDDHNLGGNLGRAVRAALLWMARGDMAMDEALRLSALPTEPEPTVLDAETGAPYTGAK